MADEDTIIAHKAANSDSFSSVLIDSAKNIAMVILTKYTPEYLLWRNSRISLRDLVISGIIFERPVNVARTEKFLPKNGTKFLKKSHIQNSYFMLYSATSKIWHFTKTIIAAAHVATRSKRRGVPAAIPANKRPLVGTINDADTAYLAVLRARLLFEILPYQYLRAYHTHIFMKNNIPQEKWGSQLGVVIAVLGSAVGLGNFLRFPGQAAIYGGVSFMIPYFIAFLLIGLPLAWTEWALGRAGGSRGFHSVPGILRCITGKRWAAYLGSVGIMVPALIFMYYVLIESWCLVYAVRYLFGSMHLGDSGAFKAFFGELTCVNENGAMFAEIFNLRFGAFVLCFAINFWLIYRGIARGIETFCKFAMPLLILFSVIILIRVLTLGNPTGIEGQSLQDGLGYVWNPIREGQTLFSSLSNAEAWLAAAGQVFFSLSLGMGIVITYASYMDKDDDIVLSGLTAASGNGFCEVVLASMMVVPAAVMFLGPEFMTAENLGSSFTIGFQALPRVFDLMPFGQVFGFFFFALLFLAAVTSSVSILQPTIAFVEEAFGTNRHVSVGILAVLNLAGASFIAYFSKGLTALDTIDFWIANVFLFVVAGVQVFAFAWVLGIDNGIQELRHGAHIPVPNFLKFIIKYVSPTYLLIVFSCWVYRNLPSRWEQICSDRVVQLSIGMILLVSIVCFFATRRSLKRWEEKEKKKN